MDVKNIFTGNVFTVGGVYKGNEHWMLLKIDCNTEQLIGSEEELLTIRDQFEKYEKESKGQYNFLPIILDVSQVTLIDSVGLWVVSAASMISMKSKGVPVVIIGANNFVKSFLAHTDPKQIQCVHAEMSDFVFKYDTIIVGLYQRF